MVAFNTGDRSGTLIQIPGDAVIECNLKGDGICRIYSPSLVTNGLRKGQVARFYPNAIKFHANMDCRGEAEISEIILPKTIYDIAMIEFSTPLPPNVHVGDYIVAVDNPALK